MGMKARSAAPARALDPLVADLTLEYQRGVVTMRSYDAHDQTIARIAAASLSQRRALADALEPTLRRGLDDVAVDRLTGRPRLDDASHFALQDLGACCGDDLAPPLDLVEMVAERVGLSHVPPSMAAALGGQQWLWEKSVERAVATARAFVETGAVQKRPRTAPIQTDWPLHAIVAVIAMELSIGWNDTVDALAAEPELRPLRRQLPKDVWTLYDRQGQPRERFDFDDPAVRRPVVAALLEYVRTP